PSSHLILLLNDPATTELYTLSLHDALPICDGRDGFGVLHGGFGIGQEGVDGGGDVFGADGVEAGEAGEVEQGVGHCRVGADRGYQSRWGLCRESVGCGGLGGWPRPGGGCGPCPPD